MLNSQNFVRNINVITNLVKIVYSRFGNICKMGVDNQVLESLSRKLAPPLSRDSHKGQAGRIGIVGGSLEYTGAPYFAGISGLKVGADLVHIFCAKEAAPIIKSYSPELIVHPVLNDNNAIGKIMPWLERLHVLVIGPGLGRDQATFENVEKLISTCRTLKKPLVIDADGLFLISSKPELIKNYPGVILTPNVVEFTRLFGSTSNMNVNKEISDRFGENCFVVRKGKDDEFYSATQEGSCSISGSARRCGGQGDLLSGSLAVFYNWSLQRGDKNETNIFAACYAACKLTRECNFKAFQKYGRSMTTTDMIQEIGGVFKSEFESS